MATRAAPVAAHLAALNSGGVPISSDDQNPPADDEYYSDSDDQQLSARGESEDAGEESAATQTESEGEDGYSDSLSSRLSTDRAQPAAQRLAEWAADRAADARALAASLVAAALELRDADVELFTARGEAPRRRKAPAHSATASIPWRELVTAKEQLLEHMESAERAEASLAQTHAQMGGELDEMKRLAAETELSIRKLEKIVAVDEAETEAEARPAREELQRARKALEKHRAATAAAAAAEAERAERDAAGGAELAAAHEERLASERRAAAAARAQEEAWRAALQVEVAAVAELTSISGLKRVQAEQAALQAAHAHAHARFAFTRPPRAPPAARLAMWRAMAAGASLRRRQRDGATGRMSSSQPPVWLQLTPDGGTLAVSEGQRGGGGTLLLSLRTGAIVTMEHGVKLLLRHAPSTAEVRALEASLSFTVVATDAGALHLQAKSREQLLLWWSGLQALSSVPDGARKSRGALLWQILRYRLREKGHIGGKVAPIAFKDL